MLKDKNNIASILRNKCEMQTTHKGFHFETPEVVFSSTMSYY